MNVRKRFAAVAAAAVLSGGLAVLPAASAHAGSTAPAGALTEVASFDTNVKGCWDWAHDQSYGSSAGTACAPGTNSGWVKDEKADGKCVFTETRYYDGNWRELSRWRSPSACPKNDVKRFTSPPSHNYARHVKVYMGHS
ncbi:MULTISPECIES: hypothetical protein [Streptomyces]|uniref:Uncharacterized protein n=2 Tax=Streptomyces TaxID=1883 RepID=A0A3S9PL95_STRLT|nr:hypothetical protein [Streptomyces luteoverticillatus]AZQ73103.1 hypothetical protein EKH77_19505 [Streptomyces luteoverticillatus]